MPKGEGGTEMLLSASPKEKCETGGEAMNHPSGLKANRPVAFSSCRETAESDHQMQDDMYRLNKTA